MDTTTPRSIATATGTPVLSMVMNVYKLPEGREKLTISRTNYRGVTTSRSWDVSVGNSLASVIADVMAHVGKSLQEHFVGRGAV